MSNGQASITGLVGAARMGKGLRFEEPNTLGRLFARRHMAYSEGKVASMLEAKWPGSHACPPFPKGSIERDLFECGRRVEAADLAFARHALIEATFNGR